ncbi:MAG: hypothetical protein ACLPVY_24740 [Acidimicrobiia bacterium]
MSQTWPPCSKVPGRHVANGAGAGIHVGAVELQLGRAASALGNLAGICDDIGASGFSVPASGPSSE